MKVYDKYLNEEKDRLVEVHTKWLKEIDFYVEYLQEQLAVSEQKLIETTEIFIERFERLENKIKELEKPIDSKDKTVYLDKNKFHRAIVLDIDQKELVDRLKGEI